MTPGNRFVTAPKTRPPVRSARPLAVDARLYSSAPPHFPGAWISPVAGASLDADVLSRAWIDLVDTDSLEALGAELAPKGRIPMVLEGARDAETWLEADELKF